ncbi:hypothetical protein GCM10023160_20760 [Brachybacterium paraconglomeratum]
MALDQRVGGDHQARGRQVHHRGIVPRPHFDLAAVAQVGEHAGEERGLTARSAGVLGAAVRDAVVGSVACHVPSVPDPDR